VYTDIDQIVLWNGALDYSKGIYHEPFFYGQAYNYMLESFVAVPFIWMNVPIYMAVPIATSLISILPFLSLGFIFRRQGRNLCALLSLAIPIVSPLEYSFLTTISRGFVQAHLFLPFLFLVFASPRKNGSSIFLWPIAALCILANPSCVLLVIPISVYLFSYHYRSISFYLSSLLTIPIGALAYLSRQFYVHNPERVLRENSGLEVNFQTLTDSLSHITHFEHIFPFISEWGILYPVVLTTFLLISITQRNTKAMLFIASLLILLLISLAIPRVQAAYSSTESGGIFFHVSRLYLVLPLAIPMLFFLIANRAKSRILYSTLIVALSLATFGLKNNNIQSKVQNMVEASGFPIAKNQELIERNEHLSLVVQKYDIDLIVHANWLGWDYVFDAYAYNPLRAHLETSVAPPISVKMSGDRRAWLYAESKRCRSILFNGVDFDTSLLQGLDHEWVDGKYLVVKNFSESSAVFKHLQLDLSNDNL